MVLDCAACCGKLRELRELSTRIPNGPNKLARNAIFETCNSSRKVIFSRARAVEPQLRHAADRLPKRVGTVEQAAASNELFSKILVREFKMSN